MSEQTLVGLAASPGVAAGLAGFAARPLRSVDSTWLAEGLARLFPNPEDDLQRAAAACLVLRSLAVVAGGPGTGKTTTVARVAAPNGGTEDRPTFLASVALPREAASA